MFHKLFHPTNEKRMLFFILFDIFLSVLTIYSAFLLRFNFHIPDDYISAMIKMVLIIIPLKIVVFYYFKLYFVVWRFFGLHEYKKLIYSHLIVYTVFSFIFFIFHDFFIPFPRSVIIIDFFLSSFVIGVLRISKRLIVQKHLLNGKKAIIYGVSNDINTLLNTDEYYIEAIVDDKSAGTYFGGIKVYPESKLEELINNFECESVLIVKKLEQSELDRLVKKLLLYDLKEIKKAVFLEDQKTSLKDISIEDLLARHPKDLDKQMIRDFVQDKTILITGAGGSIGSEIVKQCVKYGAKQLILLDHSEYNLYKIEQEIEGKISFSCVLQSVVHKKLLEKTFFQFKPEIVIHAAAYKHVPLVEENIEEAILNNIIGTKNCIDLSIHYNVEKFVLISTDKAVRPTNVMGTTKRICELYAQNIPAQKTEIVAVRFGNVLGSSGSVIPKFQEQIKKGGPITVTHPEITRYFMLISEACELVLQAGAIGKGGEIFILDMGEPVKIVDLAKKMIRLSGKEDIEIVFTGLRPGEKLYEELLLDESSAKTRYESITVAKATQYNIDKLQKDIEELLTCKEKLKKLKEIVPEFNHKANY